MWPQFLAENRNKPHLAVTLDACRDVDGVKKRARVGDKVSYWRSGKKGRKWWYNGMIGSLQWVQFPSGKFGPVMGIN